MLRPRAVSFSLLLAVIDFFLASVEVAVVAPAEGDEVLVVDSPHALDSVSEAEVWEWE